MLPISTSYIDSICEIKTLDNKLIAKGIITAIIDDYLEITYRDEVHLLAPNTQVKISIVNEKLGFKVIVGKVYVGTNTFVRIVEIITLMDFEKRDYFRIAIDEPAVFYKEKITEFEINFTEIPAIPVLLNNISLCGVFFLYDGSLELGESIYLLLDLARGQEIFPCVVRRICNNQEGNSGYGCEFVNHTQRQSDELYRFIFEKQLSYLKRQQEREF